MAPSLNNNNNTNTNNNNNNPPPPNKFRKKDKPQAQVTTKYEDCTLIYPKNLENALFIFFGRWWDQKYNNQYNSLASIQLFNNFELLLLDLNKKNGIQLQLL